MRSINSTVTEFELLPQDLKAAAQKELIHGSSKTNRRAVWRAILWRSRPARYVFYTIPLLLSITPIAVLLACSSTFSRALTENGCTPSGEFAIPFTTSVWDIKRFFSITIAFLGRGETPCDYSDPLYDMGCDGYNFTTVKIIDIFWDILVGRGVQAVLISVAYHVFGKVIKVLMSRGEVGYDLFSAVAFDVGSAMSFATIVRHAAGWTSVPRTRRAMLIYIIMGTATLYIVVVSSLLAAMTGYTPYSEPLLEMVPTDARPDGGTIDCSGTLYPVWGRIEEYEHYFYPKSIPQASPIAFGYDGGSMMVISTGVKIDYYRYQDVYEACPEQFNLTHCEAAQQDTYIVYSSGERQRLSAPMPGIIPYSNSSNGVSNHWLCGSDIFKTWGGTYGEKEDGTYVIGTCRSGSGYAWGFSFLFTFVASVLNLVFTILMYLLWFEVQRADQPGKDVGTLKDAVTKASESKIPHAVC